MSHCISVCWYFILVDSKTMSGVAEQEDQTIWVLITPRGSWTPMACQNQLFYLCYRDKKMYPPLLVLHFLSHKNSGFCSSSTTIFSRTWGTSKSPTLTSNIWRVCHVYWCYSKSTHSLLAEGSVFTNQPCKEWELYGSLLPLWAQLGIQVWEKMTFD